MEKMGSVVFLAGMLIGFLASCAILGIMSENTWVWHDGYYAAYKLQKEGKLEEFAPSSIKEKFEIEQIKKKFEGRK